jgi:hypothetical protein
VSPAATGSEELPVWPVEGPNDQNLVEQETWAVRIIHDGTTSPYERMAESLMMFPGTGTNTPVVTWPVVGENRVMSYWQGPSPRQAAEAVRSEVATWPGIISVEVGRIDFSLPRDG